MPRFANSPPSGNDIFVTNASVAVFLECYRESLDRLPLDELRAQGFNDLSSEEIVKFRIFNIDPEFIRRAKAEDPNVTVEQMVQMNIGVKRMKGTF